MDDFLTLNQLIAAAKNAPEDASLHHQLGTALVKKGRIREASHAYRQAVSLAPLDVRFRHSLGWAYARTGRLDAAISEFEEAIGLSPVGAGRGQTAIALANTLFIRSQKQRKASDLHKAQSVLLRVIEFEPTNMDAYYGLARVERCLGDFESAEADLIKLIDRAPDYQKAPRELFWLYMSTGKWGKGWRTFSAALSYAIRAEIASDQGK